MLFRFWQILLQSPKLPGANFLAVKKSDRRPPIDVASITLPRSPVSLSSGDEVPHIFTRKSRLRPKEFLIASAKRLLQKSARSRLTIHLGGYPLIEVKRREMPRRGNACSWTRSRHYGQGRKHHAPPPNVETARSRHAIVPFTRQPSHRRGRHQLQSDAGN